MHDERMHKVQPIIGGGGICNRPHVYFSDSADKLPTDAVDGSLAVVEEVTHLLKYVFNDELPNLGESASAWANNNCCSPFEIAFKGFTGTEYNAFSIHQPGSSSWGIYTLAFSNGANSELQIYTHNPSGNYGITHGWGNDGFKTILVSYADDEALAWLNAHATQGVTDETITKSTLYSRVNGLWLSEGEVDFTDLSSS